MYILTAGAGYCGASLTYRHEGLEEGLPEAHRARRLVFYWIIHINLIFWRAKIALECLCDVGEKRLFIHPIALAEIFVAHQHIIRLVGVLDLRFWRTILTILCTQRLHTPPAACSPSRSLSQRRCGQWREGLCVSACVLCVCVRVCVWVSAGACVSISHAPSLSLAQIAKAFTDGIAHRWSGEASMRLVPAADTSRSRHSRKPWRKLHYVHLNFHSTHTWMVWRLATEANASSSSPRVECMSALMESLGSMPSWPRWIRTGLGEWVSRPLGGLGRRSEKAGWSDFRRSRRSLLWVLTVLPSSLRDGGLGRANMPHRLCVVGCIWRT